MGNTYSFSRLDIFIVPPALSIGIINYSKQQKEVYMANDTITEVEQEYFAILDDLRESGVMNMFGAPRYLHENYKISHQDAKDIFFKWTKHGSHTNKK